MSTAALQTVQLAPGQAAWQRFRRHRLALAGAVTIVILVLGSAFGPYLLPFDDTFIDIMKRFAPPLSGAHILGTDELGRDVLARLMMGGRVSLSIGIVAMTIAMAVGILVGAFAGFYGGIVGAVLMRFVDAVLCFPAIFLLLALAALTEPGLMTTTLLIAATAWMSVARVVEAQVRSLREREFAIAAVAFGSSICGSCSVNSCPMRWRRSWLRLPSTSPRRSCSILCQLPRLRYSTAGRELGQHAQQCPNLYDERALACDCAGHCHYACRDQLQLPPATDCATRSIRA